MSEDVTNFLKQVKELGDRRIEEDEARSRELEEKILQEKRERQARRAERARSISPQKPSPANTPPPSATRTNQILDGAGLLASSPVLDSPDTAQPAPKNDPEPRNPAMDFATSSSPTKENDSPFDADPKRSSFAGPSQSRASPLSWQRRPNSQAAPKNRPLSMVATENAAVRSNDRDSSSEDNITKDQISQALSSKDPTWFRQTAERGQNSAAFRRSQVEDHDRLDMPSLKTQLPGMSRESSAEPQKDAESPQHTEAPAARGNLSSPFPLTPSQRLDPPSASSHPTATPIDGSSTPTLPGSGRTPPIRSNSPTKGVGGFVQSAMMKRSDSVNKRWSVQSPSGLARAGSMATSRQSRDMGRMHSPKPSISSRPVSMFQPATSSSNEPRPSSSHKKEEDHSETELRSEGPTSREITIDTSVGTEEEENPIQGDKQETPPTSPSKTMDPRRWSPTKSSWLESALSKPESPKPKAAPPGSQQPSWMVELNKSKAQKANNPGADLGRSPTVLHRHAVNTGGLMRAPPPGTNVKPPATISGLEGIASTKATSVRTSVGSMRGNLKKAAPAPVPVKQSGLGAESGGSDGKRTVVGNKAKPQTPPKKDFRANLKPRPTGDSLGDKNGQGSADELKNVVGKLRRTTTQKHVAPDEFKDNLLRGKAALNATGGPKRSEHKDELKDAILKKKEDIKKAQLEGRGVTKKPSIITDDDKALPEGLAKRAALGQPHPGTSSVVSQGLGGKLEASKSSVLSQRNSSDALSTAPGPKASEAPVPGPNRVSNFSSTARTTSPAPASTPKQAPGFQPTKPLRASTETSRPVSQPREPFATPSLRKEPSAPARLQEKSAASGSLANRFNPALAGLLARGPPASGPALSNGGSGSGLSTSQSASSNEPQGPGPQLTHITKGRARGPRRKAPSSTAATATKNPEKTTIQEIPEVPTTSQATVAGLGPETETAKTEEASVPPFQSTSHSTTYLSSRPAVEPSDMSPPNKAVALGNVIPLVDSSQKTVEIKPQPQGHRIALLDSPRPNLPPENPLQEQQMEPAQISMASIHEQVAIAAAAKKGLPPPKRLLEEKTGEKMVQPPSPKKLDMSRVFKFDHPDAEPPKPVEQFRSDPKPAVKPKPTMERPASPAKEAILPKTTSRPQPPRPLPEPTLPQKKEEPHPTTSARDHIVERRLPATPNLPPSTSLQSAPEASSLQTAQSSLTLSSRPLPVPPVSGDPISPPPRSRSPIRSPRRQGSDIAGILNDFFGPTRPKREYQVDTASILTTKPQNQGRIQTLKTQLFQVSETGMKQAVPTHHERVLFEREMYICPHAYQNEARKKVTEVYFWVGDEVPPAAVEDAESFVNKEARAMGGKLIKIQQGKETPEFIQALGGIAIVRKGSSNKYDSLAPNMLCGRRHMGQIVFDEVDFSAQNLCSGFPFLITQQGRCYLWKGKGSDVDELSCARLIGMDLTLTGELDEVEDGNEPPSFWDIFNGRSHMGSADHWRLKPNYQRYCSRLFCSDASSRQKIHEVSPFSQIDLSPSNIYVVDAFFELYIIVGAKAQSEYASFHNALDFAQEYSILAAGMEDRPFVPVSTVVLEGIPKDLRSVFRKWRDSHSPTIMHFPESEPVSAGGSSPGLKRGRSLRIVPLNMALQALSD